MCVHIYIRIHMCVYFSIVKVGWGLVVRLCVCVCACMHISVYGYIHMYACVRIYLLVRSLVIVG